jgi:hypothetical protein
MENQQQRNIPTELQINGPILSFVTDPSNVTVSTGQTVIFTGLATATFPTQVPANDAVGMGTIAYRWYEVGIGALSDISAPTSAIVGSATTFLQIHNPTASDRGRQFYLGADYVPNYPVPNVGFGTTTPITPNAPNEPHFSESALLNIYPEIIVDTQPSDVTVGEGAVANFAVDARMSIDGFGSIAYQWRVDGSPVNDGVYATGNETVVNVDKFQVLALPLWNGGAGSTLDLTDYSENAKTITPGTTEPSWSGTGPGGGGTPSWVSTGIATAHFYEGAAYFNGDEYDYLNVSASEDFDFGTGAFCIELWICPQPGYHTWEVMVGVGNGAYGDGGTWFAYRREASTSNVYFYAANIAGYAHIATVSLTSFEDGGWHHVAVTKENEIIRFFFDGENKTRTDWIEAYQGTVNVDLQPYDTQRSVNAARAFAREPFGALKPGHIGMEHLDDYHRNGYYYPYAYMQDIKVYKGVAKYTEQFSPSKDPIIDLKNSQNYSLLTTVSRSHAGYPKENLFDGVLSDQVYLWCSTEDYVETDFSSLSGGGLAVVSTVSVYIRSASGGGTVTLTKSDGTEISEDFPAKWNVLYPIAFGTGTLAKIKIQAGQYGSSSFNPGAIKVDDKFLIDAIQVTSPFADNPATLALPLWNKDGSDKLTIEDVSADPQTVSQWGEVRLPSWVSTGGKWYNGYADFPGANALEISKGGQVTDFNFGVHDFTVESWIYFNDETTNTAEDIFSTGPYGFNQFTLRRVESDQLEASWNDQIILSGGLFEKNQWYHIAVTRQAGTDNGLWRLFIDGTMVAHRLTDNIDIAANVPVLIGQQSGNVWALDGGIQDFVVYNNLAKYTEDFVPPDRSILSYGRNFTTISGSRTSRLSITPTASGADIVDCVLSNPFVTTVVTNPAKLVVTQARSILKIEAYEGSQSTASLASYNLDDQEITIDSDVIKSWGNWGDTICFYSPEKDIDIEFDLYGAKGVDFDVHAAGMGWSSGDVGGEGGYSRIIFTMKKNEEYVLKGIASNNALFLYRKSSLIAVVGQGGDGGHYGPGGSGGGVNVAGSGGTGRLSGRGGGRIDIGALGENGTFGGRSNILARKILPGDTRVDDSNSGQTIKCTKGVYWREQGKGPCEDLGMIQYRTQNGTIVSNSAAIDRGFKAGYALNTTGGSNGSSDGGSGGNGATGGSAGSSSGGGGGSGYSDGSITIVDTKLGGSTGNARVNIRLGSGDFYVDDEGRILIFSCATSGKDPRTLTKVTGKVMPGTDTCIDDARWQNFKNLAKDGMKNYRLTGCASAAAGVKRIGQTQATPYNIYRMMSNPCGGGVKLRDSLTDWYDTNYAYEWLSLAFDETSGDISGYGSDYSSLSWSPATDYGFGYYGLSRGSLWVPALQTHQIDGFFTQTTYSQYTTEFWILPPGVPDF